MSQEHESETRVPLSLDAWFEKHRDVALEVSGIEDVVPDESATIARKSPPSIATRLPSGFTRSRTRQRTALSRLVWATLLVTVLSISGSLYLLVKAPVCQATVIRTEPQPTAETLSLNQT